MGNPELAGDPRVATDAERATNQKELIPQIERRMQSLPDDETVRGLNQRFLGLDEPTDVLSFGLGSTDEAPFALPPEEEASLGEVVIAYPTALRQAAEAGRTVEAEVAHLLAHGLLHLLGYDHERPEDEGAMRRREEEILAGLPTTAGPFERLHGGL